MRVGAQFDLLTLRMGHMASTALHSVQRLFGYHGFVPEVSLADAKHIDPRFVPKAPMVSGDIDASLLVELGKAGMRHGKLVSAESHPELMHSWEIMSKRAGLHRVPQLIIVESPIVNAMTVSPEEVVVTTGILKKLDFRELNAVLGHELAHATSEHQQPRLLAKGIFSLLGGLAMHRAWRPGPAVEASGGLAKTVSELLSFSIGAGIGDAAANHIAVKSTELQADLRGALVSGDPQGLVSALRKLEGHHQKKPVLSFLAGIFSGYPSTEQRISNLETIAAHMPPVVLQMPVTVIPPEPRAAQPGKEVSQVAADARVEKSPAQEMVPG